MVLSACEAGTDRAAPASSSLPQGPTTPATPNTAGATTEATPPPVVDSVLTSSTPPAESQPPVIEDDLATLSQIEASGHFSIDAQGRVPALLALPDDLAGLDRFVIFPAAETGYMIVFDNVDGPPITAPGTEQGVWIGLSVHQIDAQTRQSQEQFMADHDFETVTLGQTVAWVGSDVTPPCRPVPDEGYDTTVLSWYDKGLSLGLAIVPYPECEPGAISLQHAIEIARSIAACTGFERATPDCTFPYG
jgi:hypothetical protein